MAETIAGKFAVGSCPFLGVKPNITLKDTHTHTRIEGTFAVGSCLPLSNLFFWGGDKL